MAEGEEGRRYGRVGVGERGGRPDHTDPGVGGGGGAGRSRPEGRRGGTVTTDFGGNDFAWALVLQPDGKLVAAGSAGPAGAADFALARYLPDGRPDPTFGMGGRVTTDFGASVDEAFALVLQPDGKLVTAGLSVDGGTFDGALARYLPDGRLDPTFGTGGKVTTDLGGDERFSALVLQPDGKLVAAGTVLARYLPDGQLDPSFGTGGTVTPGGAALILQPDGKLVVAGSAGAFGDTNFLLMRYLPDGRLDPTFGMGGTVTTDFGRFALAFALVLQPDGKLVAAGEGDFALARYLPDGQLDPSFGTGGMVTTDVGGLPFALVLQPDGTLVAAGFAGGYNFGLVRYLPDGSLDATFGPVNALVAFQPIPATFDFTPDPTGCPEGFVGIYRFEARLTNTSDGSLSDLVVVVATLTHGHLLQNADGGPGGIAAQLTVPQQDGFADGVLSPDEFVDVPFLMCLTRRQPFTFMVDVFEVVDASVDAQARALPAQDRQARIGAQPPE
jgi:uncharacterized delta-60 repeat protein